MPERQHFSEAESSIYPQTLKILEFFTAKTPKSVLSVMVEGQSETLKTLVQKHAFVHSSLSNTLSAIEMAGLLEKNQQNYTLTPLAIAAKNAVNLLANSIAQGVISATIEKYQELGIEIHPKNELNIRNQIKSEGLNSESVLKVVKAISNEDRLKMLLSLKNEVAPAQQNFIVAKTELPTSSVSGNSKILESLLLVKRHGRSKRSPYSLTDFGHIVVKSLYQFNEVLKAPIAESITMQMEKDFGLAPGSINQS